MKLAKKKDDKSIAFSLALRAKRTKQAAKAGILSKGRVALTGCSVVSESMVRSVERIEITKMTRTEEAADEKWRIFAQKAREAAERGLKAAAEGKEAVDSWGRLAVERGLDAVDMSIESLRKECQALESGSG